MIEEVEPQLKDVCGWFMFFRFFLLLLLFVSLICCDDDGVWFFLVISSQQRAGRKCITTIVNLRQDLDFEKILKHMKKIFHCNGKVQPDEEYGHVILLQGDQRENAKEWLVANQIARKDEITMRGAEA
jgi:translation initiation factor 1